LALKKGRQGNNHRKEQQHVGSFTGDRPLGGVPLRSLARSPVVGAVACPWRGVDDGSVEREGPVRVRRMAQLRREASNVGRRTVLLLPTPRHFQKHVIVLWSSQSTAGAVEPGEKGPAPPPSPPESSPGVALVLQGMSGVLCWDPFAFLSRWRSSVSLALRAGESNRAVNEIVRESKLLILHKFQSA
jgi:hypothetical protein